MFKRIGLLGLLLVGTGVLLPSAVFVEEHYYPSSNGYHRDGERRTASRRDEWRQHRSYENRRRENERASVKTA